MLPKTNRVRLKREFERVFASPRAISGRFIRVKSAPNSLPLTRFGFVTSAKVSKKAVVRNRLRRRLRAVVAPLSAVLPDGFDIVVVCQPSAATSTHQDLATDVISALERLFKKKLV